MPRSPSCLPAPWRGAWLRKIVRPRLTTHSNRPTPHSLLKDKTRLTEILLFHVSKGKTASKWIVNGSGQMPTMCELPDPKSGTWKVVLCVDPKSNGKNGAPLVIGQNCATVQGLEYEVRGGKVEKADIECTNGIIHVMDTVSASPSCVARSRDGLMTHASRPSLRDPRRQVLRRVETFLYDKNEKP